MFTWKRFRAFLCLFLSVLMILPAVPVRAQEADTAVLQEADTPVSEDAAAASEAEIAPEDGAKVKSSKKDKPEDDSDAIEATATSTTSTGEDGGDGSGLGVSVQAPEASLFTGAASHKIPIDVPPGRGGLSPNIALVYSSYRQNGWVGVGWDLDLGSIQRSTKHGLDIDPDTHEYTGKDFIAVINGSKADLVQRTDWDAGGNTYGAKIEGSFMRFVAVNPDSDGQPQGGWEVTTKEGTKYFYGATSDSRQSDPATTNPHGTFKWCLNRVEDMDGNFMTITYDNALGDGEVYPKYIDYTGNTKGLSTTNRVEFTLEPRSEAADKPIRYNAHFAVQTSYRLSAITVTSSEVSENGGLIREYALAYGSSPTTSRSLLQTVTEYGSDGTALPAVNLTYTMGVNEFDDAADTNLWKQVGDYADNSKGYRMADVNNDGFQDIVYTDASSAKRLRVLLNTGAGFKTDSVWGARSTGIYGKAGGIQLADMNLDGRADFVYVDTSKRIHVLLAQPPLACGADYPDGCFAADSTVSPAVWGTQVENFYVNDATSGFRLADVNGDGYLDYVYISATRKIKVFLNNVGTGFLPESIWGNAASLNVPKSFRMADMNGDGRSDILYMQGRSSDPLHFFHHYTLIIMNAGCQNGSDCFSTFSTMYIGLSKEYRLGDINGDSLTDAVFYSDGKIRTAINLRDRLVITDTITGLCETKNSTLLDLNADGLADYFFDCHGNLHVLPGTGDGFGTDTIWGVRLRGDEDTAWTMSDINGDGLSDFVYTIFHDDHIYFRKVPHSGPYPDLLQSVSNGIGATYTLGYTPSSAYQNTNLPYVVQTLSSITVNDGNGTESVTNYTYQGGLHSFKEREFGGFASATVTSPMITNGDETSYQTSVETRFYQGNPTTGENDEKKGLIKEQVVKDKISGKYYKKSESTISTASFLSGTVKFPYLSRQDDYVWDGSTTTEDVGAAWHTYATFEYDGSGNITRKHFKGDASIPGDEKDEETDYYAKDDDTWLSSRTWKTRLKNSQGVVESETEYTYYGGAHLNRLKDKIAKAGGANGPTISYEYDSYGNVSKVTDPRGYFTTTAYDVTKTFPAVVTNPLGHQAVYTYDYRFGKVKTRQDPNHDAATNPNIVQYVYDPFGRIQMEIGPDACANGWTAYYLYNSFGTVGAQNVETRRTEACGVSGYIWKKAYFDGLGREIKAEAEGSPDSLGNPRTITSHTIYDLKGQVSKKCIPHFGSICTTEVTNEYDPVGRTVKTISPDDSPYNPTGESITQTAYAKTRTTVTDPNGHIKTAVKDSYGRLSAVEEYSAEPACNPCTTSYGYDARGNLTGVTDAHGNHTTIVYDDLSRKTGMTDPDMGTWAYGYDASGNLIVQQDANGKIMNFVYDSLNRAIRKYSSDSSVNVYYYYDEGAAADNVKGRLTRSEDASGNTRYYYDKFGKAKKTIKTVGTESYTSEASYDYLGRPLTVTNPFKTGETPEAITYQYDAGGNLSNVLNYAAYSDYNALGQVGKITFQTGTTTTYGYYPLTNKLESVVTTPPPPQAGKLQDLAYEYDSVGNVKKVTDSTNLQSIQVYGYGYDELDRLDWANYPSIGQIDYNYDSIGNITYNSRVGAYSYIGAGPHAVTGAGGETFQYDANGNMTGIDVGTAQEKLFEYDAENRLARFKIKQTNGSYATIQYVYDGSGQRVKKISSSGATTIYIGNLELRGTEKTTHYFGGDKRIATKVGSDLYALHSDHLGGLNVADLAGTERQRNTYLPFGEDFQSSGTANLRHKYTDQEQDPETTIGLYYYGARYYYPKIGRFITPDSIVQAPADPQTLNRYSYCRNNPLRYTDPTGHGFLAVLGLLFLGAAAGAAIAAISGGNIGLGALTGAISAGFFLGAGQLAVTMGLVQVTQAGLVYTSTQAFAATVGLHVAAGAASGAINGGITGGDVGMAAVTGGISGGMGKFLGSYIPHIDNEIADFGVGLAGHSAIGGLTGGIAAELYGGDFGQGFGQGAWTAGFAYTFNNRGMVLLNRASLFLERYVSRVGARAWDGVKSLFSRSGNSFYEIGGFKFKPEYYERLLNTGRPYPGLTAREVLETATRITPDPKGMPGFLRYDNGIWEMIYNPTTKEVFHLQPLK